MFKFKSLPQELLQQKSSSAGNGEAKSPEKQLRPSQAQGEEITKMASAETLEKSPQAAIHAFAAGRLTL